MNNYFVTNTKFDDQPNRMSELQDSFNKANTGVQGINAWLCINFVLSAMCYMERIHPIKNLSDMTMYISRKAFYQLIDDIPECDRFRHISFTEHNMLYTRPHIVLRGVHVYPVDNVEYTMKDDKDYTWECGKIDYDGNTLYLFYIQGN